jgi:hypothetical protein
MRDVIISFGSDLPTSFTVVSISTSPWPSTGFERCHYSLSIAATVEVNTSGSGLFSFPAYGRDRRWVGVAMAD